jgi:hypothetical protein
MLTALPIKEVWSFVKPKLEEIKARCRTDWEPQDIYDDCLTGTAFLYGVDEDRSFVVTVPRINPFTGKAELFIWAAWGDGVTQGKHMDKLYEIANGIGADCLTMASPRRGYERTGWKVKEVVYAREVPKQ